MLCLESLSGVFFIHSFSIWYLREWNLVNGDKIIEFVYGLLLRHIDIYVYGLVFVWHHLNVK